MSISYVTGYTTKKPDQFALQDGGSALAVDALAAVFGSLLHQEIDILFTVHIRWSLV
jgi:hypothetical protein